MSTVRRPRAMVAFALIAVATTGLVSAIPVARAAAAELDAALEAPIQASIGAATAITLRLPPRVAAVEGRLLLDAGVAELVGVAPVEGGQTFAPVALAGAGGFAFAAYDLKPTGGRTVLRLVVAGNLAGSLETRVLIDAAADAAGSRITVGRANLRTTLHVEKGGKSMAAPGGTARAAPTRAQRPARDLLPDGVISIDDLDAFRSAWYEARTADNQCQPGFDRVNDANGDGCIDVVDIQALLADQGQLRAASRPLAGSVRGAAAIQMADVPAAGRLSTAALAFTHTFVVTSTADTPDASQGNGVCADSQGRCTLRAAIMEANWQTGDQLINFNLPGAAPVTIQVGSALPNIGSSSARVYIDGYSQPGSQPNTAEFGTNAIQGVEVRGTGVAMSHIIYIPEAGNTIRGLLIDNSYRGIFVDTTRAANNRIIGNWIGFNRDNTLPARGYAGVMLNNGARVNYIGTPALADRNVIGNHDKGIFSYGAGTNGNVVQNNVFCIRPNGLGALCQIAIDHDFGPKDGLIGGTGPHELNVTGPTCCNGIEFSHGWNPAGPPGNYSSTWAVSGHRAIGNWIGFRPDGSYDPAFRSAQQPPEVDNGQAVNLHDGAVNNLIEGNYIAAVYDGMTLQMSGTTGNTIRNNIIGESPLGEVVPMAGWGIYARLGTRSHTIEGNIIHNTASGGIGLIEKDVRNVRISANLVTDTSGPAIYLAPDPQNTTTGANGLMPPPTISISTETGASGTGIAGSTVEMFRASRAVGSSGLPVQFLGSALVVANGSWALTYAPSLQTGQRVVATQTRSNGETSQLGINVFAGGPPPPPSGDFGWSQQPGTLKVSFTTTATGDPYSWSWSFGDGGTSSRQNPIWTYGAGGSYNVSLTVTNESGSQVTTKTVSVTPIPPGTVIASDSFTRTLAGEWGIADVGGPYSLDGPSSRFNVGAGVGNIVLTNTNETRGVRLDSVSLRDVDVRVRVSANKVATGNGQLYAYLAIRANGTTAYRPKIIIYPNGSVNAHSGVMVNGNESSLGTSVAVPGLTYTAGRWIWLRAQVTGVNPTTIRVKAWADGSTEPNNWQFTATNSAAALQAAGSVGLHTYMSSTNAPTTFSFDDFSAVVPGGTPAAPVANFTAAQRAGTLIVDFSDTSTGSPTAWSWNFGDGTSSTQRNPAKTYAAAGNYSVTLTASNASGSNSITKTVSVVPIPPPPAPVATFTSSQVANTLTVNFTDTSTGAPTAWSWNFGDGTSSSQQNPSKTYAAAGDFSVTLTASNAGGPNSITKTVSVVPIPPPQQPTANFTFSQVANTLTVTFSDTSTGSPTSWSWNFGDSTSSSQQNPSKTYTAAGDYSVTLTASNAGGSNAITKTVTVAPIPAFSTYVNDSFSRTTSNGWGTADVGGAYGLLGTAANFSVGGGVGSIVVPSAGTTRSALLNGASARDVDITFRVRADKIPAGGAYFIYAAARVNGNNEYRPRILLNANGTVSAHASVLINGAESPLGTAVVVAGLTQSVNNFIWFRAQVAGSGTTTIRVRVWADGQVEPTTWQFTTTNNAASLQTAGSLGLRAYTNSGISNAPVTLRFDDYLVTSPR